MYGKRRLKEVAKYEYHHRESARLICIGGACGGQRYLVVRNRLKMYEHKANVVRASTYPSWNEMQRGTRRGWLQSELSLKNPGAGVGITSMIDLSARKEGKTQPCAALSSAWAPAHAVMGSAGARPAGLLTAIMHPWLSWSERSRAALSTGHLWRGSLVGGRPLMQHLFDP